QVGALLAALAEQASDEVAAGGEGAGVGHDGIWVDTHQPLRGATCSARFCCPTDRPAVASTRWLDPPLRIRPCPRGGPPSSTCVSSTRACSVPTIAWSCWR